MKCTTLILRFIDNHMMVTGYWRSSLRWTYTGTPSGIEQRQARYIIKGHSRSQVREIRVAVELVGDLDWPYLQPVFELRRTWKQHNAAKHEARYGTRCRPAMVALAEQVLTLERGRWGIENPLHLTVERQVLQNVKYHQGHYLNNRFRAAS